MIILVLKGLAIGTANVIPGVSGGTIALITNILERLLNALKKFDFQAMVLFFTGKWKEFARHTDLVFLAQVLLGVVIAVFSLAEVMAFLFRNYPVFISAYFFGLIAASVYFVSKTIRKWNPMVYLFFFVGTAIAVSISFLNPLTENTNFFYLGFNGTVAACAMILPGLSGSFALLLLGNYTLIMEALANFNLDILIPFLIGCFIGLILFSMFLSWLYKKYHNETTALLAGFVLGSLRALWPWKEMVQLTDRMGNLVFNGDQPVIAKWQIYFPTQFDTPLLIALALILAGILSIWAIEKIVEIRNI